MRKNREWGKSKIFNKNVPFFFSLIIFSFLNVCSEARRLKSNSQHLIFHRVQDKPLSTVEKSYLYEMLEIDVREYRGQIFVLHDEVVPSLDTESLSEFLRRHNGKRIQIDVKVDSKNGLTAVDAQILYEILVEEKMVDKVIVTSKDLTFLRELREIDENIKLGYDPSLVFYSENKSKAEILAFITYLEEVVKELGLSFISLPERIAFLFIQIGIAKNFVHDMERRGCIVDVWTVNDRENIRKLTYYGFWVTTDLDTP